MEIRRARKDDLNFILEGIKEICEIENEKINNLNLLKNKLKKSIRRGGIICVIKDEKIRGFLEFIFSKKEPYGINYENEKKSFCWINNLYISKELRRKGIGTKLLQELEKICKEKEINKIMFDVFAVNKRAKKFYDKMKFGIKLQIMEKELK